MTKVRHIQHQIAPIAHTSLYNWHKFWARKTWNVVAEFIKAYTDAGDVVFDPFVGSGVTAIEALKNNRRVIACDLNPIATTISHLTIKPVDVLQLKRAFQKIAVKVKDKILALYTTSCRKCKREITLSCTIWNKGVPSEVRYICPYCKDRQAKGCPPDSSDKVRIETLESTPIQGWHPRNPLYYPNGKPFKEKQHYEALDDLFTKRNLQALSWLMETIEEEENIELREFLKIAFTSMVHLCTKMMPISEAGHFTPFSSAWIQHSYWYATEFMEQNVWDKYESAIEGHQGLLNAKTESNKYFKNVKFANDYNQVLKKKADVYIHTGDALDLMKSMAKKGAVVDYIFTDPPYDASIQYGELTYLWVAWLRKDKDYLQTMLRDEIIRNESQNKDFDVYHSMLANAFKRMYDVVKNDGYLTLTFHNPTFRIRNATIRAGVFAGFDFQKIHHQELARPSAKSLLQPFGSATGDFFIRFYKATPGKKVAHYKEIDEDRFNNIVTDTTIKVLAERSEPTPYTIIINAVDPVLAKNGFFSKLHTGLDVRGVLENHLGKEFELVDSKIGGAEGKLWWFKDPSIIPHHDIPLSERVEQTVVRLLQSEYKVTFTDVLKFVSRHFPNALTSDSTSIKETLQEYATPASGGLWTLKPLLRQRISQHTELIGILAQIGHAYGFSTWVGKREQREKWTGGPSEKLKVLKEMCKPTSLTLKGLSSQQIKNIQNIDLIWYKNGKIHSIFEVEHTTMLTEALDRGSNTPHDVNRYMVIPEERENKLKSKMKSPMFNKQFTQDGWKILYYDTIRVNLGKIKSKKMKLVELAGKRTGVPATGKNPKSGSTLQVTFDF